MFSIPALTADVPQPTSWQLCVLAVALACPWAQARLRRPLALGAVAAIALLEWQARRSGAPEGLLRVTFLDVGQGDSAIVDLPDGEALLVDGGGLVGSPIDVGARVVAPELRLRRRRRIAAVVLTHPHPDHFTGLVQGLEHVQVGALWDTGQGEAEAVGGLYSTLLARARASSVAVLRPDSLCGSRTIGGAQVDVLVRRCALRSSDRGPNDNSFVLRIRYGARAVLFVGDAEQEEEASLLGADPARLRADVLKVGHHGSRISTSASPCGAAVAPTLAVASPPWGAGTTSAIRATTPCGPSRARGAGCVGRTTTAP